MSLLLFKMFFLFKMLLLFSVSLLVTFMFRRSFLCAVVVAGLLLFIVVILKTCSL